MFNWFRLAALSAVILTCYPVDAADLAVGEAFEHASQAGAGYPFISSCCRDRNPCCQQLWAGFCQKQRSACHSLSSWQKGGKGHGDCGARCGSCQKGGKTHRQHGAKCGCHQQRQPLYRGHLQFGCGSGKCGHAVHAAGKGKGKGHTGCGSLPYGRLGLFDWQPGKGSGCHSRGGKGHKQSGSGKWYGGHVEGDGGGALVAPPEPGYVPTDSAVPYPEFGPSARLRRLPRTF